MSELVNINVITTIGKFVLLGFETSEDRGAWLLVALSGATESFTLNNASWTKVVHGQSSRQLRGNSTSEVVGWVLQEQLGRAISEVRVVPENGL